MGGKWPKMMSKSLYIPQCGGEDRWAAGPKHEPRVQLLERVPEGGHVGRRCGAAVHVRVAAAADPPGVELPLAHHARDLVPQELVPVEVAGAKVRQCPHQVIYVVPPAAGPNWSHRRSPSTNQHPISMGTKQSTVHGAREAVWRVRNARNVAQNDVEVAAPPASHRLQVGEPNGLGLVAHLGDRDEATTEMSHIMTGLVQSAPSA